MANPISRDLAPIIKWITDKLAKNPEASEETILREARSQFKKEANPAQVQSAFDEAIARRSPQGKVQQAVVNNKAPVYTTKTREQERPTLASKLAPLVAGSKIDADTLAETRARDAFNLLPENKKTASDFATLKRNAVEKQGLSSQQLASDFERTYYPPESKKVPLSLEETSYAGFAADELPVRSIDENEVVSSGLEGIVRRPDEDIVGRGAGEPVKEPAPPLKEPTKQEPLPEDETTQWAGYRGQDQEVELGTEPTDLSSLARTPEVEAPSGAGGFAPEVEETRKKFKPGSRVTTGAGIAGTAAAMTAAGTLLIQDEKTGKTTPVFVPQISPTGQVTMSDEEKKYYEKQDAGWQTEQKRNKEFAAINNEARTKVADLYDSIGRTLPPENSPEYRTELRKATQEIVNSRFAPQPAETSPAEEAVVEAAPPKTEEEAVPPPSAPAKPATTIAAALKAPSEEKRAVEPTKEPTAEVAAAQASFPNSLTALLAADLKLSNSLTGGGQPVDRSSIKEALDKLTQVGNELEIMYDGNPPPALADVARARRDAFRAYKEQARVNDWLSIVDRAIGAIGQFASAQAAMGTPYIGNYKPSTIDYDAKTQQALREYQAEVGLLQQEREESEQARSRYFKEKEMTADQLYKKYQLGLEKAKLEVAEKQEIQDRADKWSKTFFDALQNGRKENKRLLQTTAEYQQKKAAAAEKQTADTQKEFFTATSNLLKVQASQLENEIKKTEGYIAAATKYADKDTPETRAAFAAYGKDITGEIEEKKGPAILPPYEPGARKLVLQGIAADASTKLQQLRDNLDKVQEQQVKLLQGRVAGVAPESPAGQEPGGGGKVPEKKVLYQAGSIVEQNGKKYKVLKDYSAGDSASGVFEEVK